MDIKLISKNNLQSSNKAVKMNQGICIIYSIKS